MASLEARLAKVEQMLDPPRRAYVFWGFERPDETFEEAKATAGIMDDEDIVAVFRFVGFWDGDATGPAPWVARPVPADPKPAPPVREGEAKGWGTREPRW